MLPHPLLKKGSSLQLKLASRLLGVSYFVKIWNHSFPFGLSLLILSSTTAIGESLKSAGPDNCEATSHLTRMASQCPLGLITCTCYVFVGGNFSASISSITARIWIIYLNLDTTSRKSLSHILENNRQRITTVNRVSCKYLYECVNVIMLQLLNVFKKLIFFNKVT